MQFFTKHLAPHTLQNAALLTVSVASSALGVLGFLLVLFSLILWLLNR